MAANWNEYTYEKQFEGNLRGTSDPVPARVHTSLRMMSRETVQELLKLDHRSSGAPPIRFPAAGWSAAPSESAGHWTSLF